MICVKETLLWKIKSFWWKKQKEVALNENTSLKRKIVEKEKENVSKKKKIVDYAFHATTIDKNEVKFLKNKID